ncbi:metallophosphoesterase [Flavobacteriaceae bacterium AU392]|nr:metallophosphoesterase [Flavobacteriaceae bacterium]RKM86597.1 metallophosphoesterase [Flavobacteriaceae bacterium AU392]
MTRWIIFIVVCGIIDFYAFQAFKTVIKSSWITGIYSIVSVFILANFSYQLFTFNRAIGIDSGLASASALFILIYVPKLVLITTLFVEDIFRLFETIFNYFSRNEILNESSYAPSRRSFISKIALGLAAIPFGSILYGIFKGKYNFKVLKYSLYFEDLPEAFDGYKLTQISDVHSGSFDNVKKVEYAIDLINKQQSDVLLFTGDLVNNKAEEMHPYINAFKKLNAKDGMFSVLGNHDYGDYVNWNTDIEKSQNLEDLKSLQKEIGFDLLLNENRFIEKNGERIALIGVENWGKGFKQKGDLKKASQNVDINDFKILMSHDPSHWEEEVVNDKYHYHLTLSGHTHGMQFGIEIPGWFKWSPVKWRYKHWAGIYKELGQYINVNRGFGYLAFPGRVGIWPEITVIELKKGSNNT